MKFDDLLGRAAFVLDVHRRSISADSAYFAYVTEQQLAGRPAMPRHFWRLMPPHAVWDYEGKK